MSDPILPLLVMIVVALLALAVAAQRFAHGSRAAVGLVGAGILGLGFLLTLLALVVGQDPGTLALPIGPPDLPITLSFDPLAAFFLLPIFVAGAASMAFIAEIAMPERMAGLAGQSVCFAAVVLALLASDGITLAVALGIAGGAIWASGDPGPERHGQLGLFALAALAILGASAPSGFAFAAMREVSDPPLVVTILLAVGGAALAGLVPFHGWNRRAHLPTPIGAAAQVSGFVQPLGLYLLVRFTLDLNGTTVLAWPLLAMGAATALTGGWRAVAGGEVGTCLAALTERQAGLVAIGAGLTLIGRKADLPDATMAAQAAIFLLVFAHVIGGTLGQLSAGAIETGAGSRRLMALGGLCQAMPVAAAGIGVTLFGFSALPVGAGFAALWLLFHALLAVPRSPLLALVIVALAVSATLSGIAAVRIFGVACLGRPRGPRSASAVDIAKTARPAVLALVGIALAIGALPGVVTMLANPAIRFLHASSLDDRFGILGFNGYQVLPLLVIGLAIGLAILRVRARLGTGGEGTGPAWHDGFAAPPRWLPFGDPLTQSAGAGFLPALPRIPPLPALPDTRRWVRRVAALPMLLAVMALCLIALLWAGGA